MSDEPVLKPIGDSLWVVYRDRGATLEFARLHERGDSLSAEVAIANADGVELHWARVNLASTQGRGALVKAVEEAEPSGDWRPMIDRACRLVAKHVRTGEPAVPLVPTPPTECRWAVEGWMPLGQTTVLFGDGGAGKSYLALTLALSGLLDRAVTPRWRMTPLRRVLYLDWEADQAEQQTRLWRLTAGLQSEPIEGALLHRTMRRPLRDELVAIRAEVARHDVDFVIADSLAPASGPEPEHADAALTALLALRSLAVTVLCIAHVSKVQADQRAPARPYGSVHIQNLARSVIEARGSEADDQEQATVSLYHRKSNQGRRQPPSALTFLFDPAGAIRVASGEPDTGGASLPYQVLAALRAGEQSASDLAQSLDVNPATVKKALQRLEDRDKVIRLGERMTGKTRERLWGLKDVRRDDHRDTAGTDENTVPF